MARRGRKSAAEPAVAQAVAIIPRPVAPIYLTDGEAEIRAAHLATMAAEFFRPSDSDALANLCRHTIAARRMSAWIEKAPDDIDTSLGDMERLLRMRERETRAATAMPRTLRLTKQSHISARGATGKQASLARRKWEPATWDEAPEGRTCLFFGQNAVSGDQAGLIAKSY